MASMGPKADLQPKPPAPVCIRRDCAYIGIDASAACLRLIGALPAAPLSNRSKEACATPLAIDP